MGRDDDRPGEGASSAVRARWIEGELDRLVRQVQGELFGQGVALPRSVRLVVEQEVHPDPTGSPPGDLLHRVRQLLEEAAVADSPVGHGVVFCFRCDQHDCDHVRPPRSTAVFAGYSPTGQPLWSDLLQVLLEAGDGRVDRLSRPGGDPVAVVVLGRDLKGRQLRPFGRGSRAYGLLAQVIAGYFQKGRGRERAERFAVTVQVVESRDGAGRLRLLLNVVGLMPDGSSVEEALGKGQIERLGRPLALARRRLAELETLVGKNGHRGRPKSRPEELSRVPGILHDLRRAIEQGARQEGRRTRHSEERRRDNRPTPAAGRDLERATDDAILRDESRDTFIVLGPRGRAHVFAPDGRHVTSLSLEGEEIERRLERERWRPATGDQIERLRKVASAKSSSGGDGEGGTSARRPRRRRRDRSSAR